MARSALQSVLPVAALAGIIIADAREQIAKRLQGHHRFDRKAAQDKHEHRDADRSLNGLRLESEGAENPQHNGMHQIHAHQKRDHRTDHPRGFADILFCKQEDARRLRDLKAA